MGITIKRFCFIGGDLRQKQVMELLRNDGHDVTSFAYEDTDTTLDEAMGNAEIIVLPLPYTMDTSVKKYINTPEGQDKLETVEVIKRIRQDQTLLIGKADEFITELCYLKNIEYIDYFKREDFEILNAVPTAEGALAIAINEVPYTIHGCDAIVLGFGRIGKVLAMLLQKMGANVAVMARKASDFAWIKVNGYKVVDIKNIENEIGNYTLIFNTIPHRIIDKHVLANIGSNSLIIDLSSKPGGVDIESAKQLGTNVIWALSLPGKVAPVTAGKIIKDTIINIMNEGLIY